MIKLSDYPVIIPTGGEGKRLKPFTKDRSKAVVPLFNNAPITEINILNLARDLGLRDFIFGVKGYQNYLDLYSYYQGGFGWSSKMGIEPQVHFHYQNPNYEDLGGADSVLYNIKKFDINKPIVVFQNDNIFSPSDLSPLIKFSETTDYDISIGLTKVKNPAEYGLVNLTKDVNTITNFSEKMGDNAPKNALVNTGVYIIKPKAFNQLFKEFGWDVLPKFANEKRLGGFLFKQPWLDFGSAKLHQKSFQKILNNNFEYILPYLKRTSIKINNTNAWVRGRGPQSLILNENIRSLIAKKKIKIKGNIIIGRDCMIGDGVYLESCSIGDMSTIEKGAKISHSNIMDAWQIGQNVKIENSTLGRCGSVADYSQIKNSFLGDNVYVGSKKLIKNKIVLKGKKI